MKTAKATARQYILRADLVGRIWMPNCLAVKPVKYRFTRPENPESPSRRRDECDTLRDALLRVTSDGDFQSCALANATIEIQDCGKMRRRSRWFNLTGKLDKYNADLYASEDEAFAAADILDEMQA